MFCGSFVIVIMAHFSTVSQGFPSLQILTCIYALCQVCLFAYSFFVVYCRTRPFAMPLAVAFMAEQARMSMKVSKPDDDDDDDDEILACDLVHPSDTPTY